MHTGQQQDHLRTAYNRFAEHREQTELAPWKREERERFLGRLRQERRADLLEIGAGTGRDSLYFRQQGLRVVAVDLAEEMVRRCHEKGLDARLMDFGRLDFPAAAFDAVYAMNCLLHVPKAELDGVLKEICRVLKPEGLFFCGVYGGQETEGVWERDFYEPKRFFSMFEDDSLLRAVRRRFRVEDFHTVEMEPEAPHFQSLLLRKTKLSS